MTLRLSIVTPSYNQGAFLERTIRSVLNQSRPADEYFVIDGASSDDSVSVIRVYADRLSGWVSERDSGQGEAINKGFARASGDIFAWINSDDFYLPGAFETVMRLFEDDPSVTFVYGDVLSVDRDGALMNVMRFAPYDWLDLAQFQIISQPAVFFRRELWDACGGLDLSYHFLLDHQLWLRMTAGRKLTYIAAPLAAARFYAEAKNRAHTEKFGMEAHRIADWLLSDAALREQTTPIRNGILGCADWLDANYLSTGGRVASALRAYARAFLRAPGRVVADWRRVALTMLALVSEKAADSVQAAQSQKRLSGLASYRDLLRADELADAGQLTGEER